MMTQVKDPFGWTNIRVPLHSRVRVTGPKDQGSEGKVLGFMRGLVWVQLDNGDTHYYRNNELEVL